MAGAGTIGVGGAGSGVGVGGWQLYENVINPTLDNQLSKGNYQYQPVRVPLNEQVLAETNNKYNWKNWGCVSKLFPNLSIVHTAHTPQATTSPTPASYETVMDFDNKYKDSNWQRQEPLYLNIPTSTNNLVACGLFDWRGGSDASKNKIYFKSEVVVKDEHHGWVMWNGLSSNPSNTSQKVDFEYRLLTFKKEGDGWKIDRGFAWSTPVSSTESKAQDQLQVTIPQGHRWQNADNNAGEGYSTRKVWSGIARLDKSVDQHIVKSLQVYMWSKDANKNSNAGTNYNAEFFGLNGGKWMGQEQNRGYTKTNKMYVEGKGWQTINIDLDLGRSLTKWYAPYVNKKIGWTTCGQWSKERKSGSNMSLADQEIRNVCYSPKSTTVN